MKIPVRTMAKRLSERRVALDWSWRPESKPRFAPELEALDWVGATRNELTELEDAIQGDNRAEMQMELGDAIMDLFHVAFVLDVDPHIALRGSLSKIARRMDYVEKRLKDPRDLAARKRLWSEAKESE